MEDNLSNLNLFLEASRVGKDSTNGFPNLLLGLEQDVEGGGGDSNELNLVVGGEPDLGNQC